MSHHHHHHGHQHADGTDCHCEPEQGDAVSVVDPVCGMTIDKGSTSLTAHYGGTTHYFCSPGCRTSFVAAPKAYVSQA